MTGHTGATEDYAAVLAAMRVDIAELGEGSDAHVDGGDCRYEVAVVWHCAVCGREQHQVLAPATHVARRSTG
jgi:hypothetical protein